MKIKIKKYEKYKDGGTRVVYTDTGKFIWNWKINTDHQGRVYADRISENKLLSKKLGEKIIKQIKKYELQSDRQSSC